MKKNNKILFFVKAVLKEMVITLFLNRGGHVVLSFIGENKEFCFNL
jgi:hypothetical protein